MAASPSATTQNKQRREIAIGPNDFKSSTRDGGVRPRTTNRAASRRVAERHGETHVPYSGLATLLAHVLALTF